MKSYASKESRPINSENADAYLHEALSYLIQEIDAPSDMHILADADEQSLIVSIVQSNDRNFGALGKFFNLAERIGIVNCLPRYAQRLDKHKRRFNQSAVNDLLAAFENGRSWSKGNIVCDFSRDGSCKIRLKHELTTAQLIEALGEEYEFWIEANAKKPLPLTPSELFDRWNESEALGETSEDDIDNGGATPETKSLSCQPLTHHHPDDVRACEFLIKKILLKQFPDAAVKASYSAISGYGTYSPILIAYAKATSEAGSLGSIQDRVDGFYYLAKLGAAVKGQKPSQVVPYSSSQNVEDAFAFMLRIHENPSLLLPKLQQWHDGTALKDNIGSEEERIAARIDESYAFMVMTSQSNPARSNSIAEKNLTAWFKKHYPRFRVEDVHVFPSNWKNAYSPDQPSHWGIAVTRFSSWLPMKEVMDISFRIGTELADALDATGMRVLTMPKERSGGGDPCYALAMICPIANLQAWRGNKKAEPGMNL